MNNHVSTVHCAAAQGSINCGSCGHNVTAERSFKNPVVSVFNFRAQRHKCGIWHGWITERIYQAQAKNDQRCKMTAKTRKKNIKRHQTTTERHKMTTAKLPKKNKMQNEARMTTKRYKTMLTDHKQTFCLTWAFYMHLVSGFLR